MKRCSKCQKTMPYSAFGKKTKNKDGLNYACLSCAATSARTHYQQNHQKMVAKSRKTIFRTPNYTHKKCCSCKEIKPLSEFNKDSHHSNGLRSKCRSCTSNYMKSYRLLHLSVFQARLKKRRASIHGSSVLEDISIERLAICDHWLCHICGKKVTKHTWSIDHIIPLSQGGQHTWINVALAHKRCNSRRGPGRLPAQLRLLA